MTSRILETGSGLLLGLAPLLSRSPAWDGGAVLLVASAAACWFGLVLRERAGPRASDSGNWIFPAALLAWLLASALASTRPLGGLGHAALLAACLACAWLARSAGGGRRRLPAEATVWGGACVALSGIAEYYRLRTPEHLFPGRVAGTFENPNDLGSYLCLAIPIGIVLVLSPGSSRTRRLLATAATVLAYACLLMSGSRGAWWAGLFSGGVLVAGGIGAGLPGAVSRSRGWALALLLSLGSVTLLYTIPNPLKAPAAISIPDRLLSSGEIARGISRPGPVASTSVGHRYLIWSAAAAMLSAHPLTGVGPGGFGLEYPAFRDRILRESIRFRHLDADKRREGVRHAHNDYLQMAAEAGLPGLVLFLGFLAAWLGTGWRNVRRTPGETDRLLGLGILAAVAGVSVNALASYPLQAPAVAIPFWTFLGIVAGRGKEEA